MNLGESVTCTIKNNAEDNLIFLQVHNGGTPISAEILPKLTQAFYSTKQGGTGLGLAIVKRIVDAHGGFLSIESSQEKGTAFTIELNLSKS